MDVTEGDIWHSLSFHLLGKTAALISFFGLVWGAFFVCLGFFVLIWIWPSTVEYEWDQVSSFLLCLWFIAKQLLCNKTFQTRDIISQDLFVPRRHLSMCTGELEPSQTFGRSRKSGDVSLGRGHFAQEEQVIKYWRVHENEEHTFIIIWKGAVMIITSSVLFMQRANVHHQFITCTETVWSERTSPFPGLPVRTVWAVTTPL